MDVNTDCTAQRGLTLSDQKQMERRTLKRYSRLCVYFVEQDFPSLAYSGTFNPVTRYECECVEWVNVCEDVSVSVLS